MSRRQHHISRKHRWQRNRFNLERGQRNLLERDFSDIYLFPEHYQRNGNPDFNNE